MTTKAEKLTKNVDELLALVPGGTDDVAKKQIKTEFLPRVNPLVTDLLSIYNPVTKTYGSYSIGDLPHPSTGGGGGISGITISFDTSSFPSTVQLNLDGFEISSPTAGIVQIKNPTFKAVGVGNSSFSVDTHKFVFPTSTVLKNANEDIEITPRITITAGEGDQAVTVSSDKFKFESGITLDQGTGTDAGYGLLSVTAATFNWRMGESVSLGDAGTANTLIAGEGLVAKPGTQPDTVQLSIEDNIYLKANLPQWLSVAQKQLLMSSRLDSSDAKSAVWFGDSLLPLPVDMVGDNVDKSISVTPMPGKDVEQFLVIFKLNFYDTAPDDGFIRIYVKDTAAEEGSHSAVYVRDITGAPLAAQREYKKNESLGEILVVGVVELKVTTAFRFHVIHSFDQWIMLDRYIDNPSAILIQSVDTDAKGLYEFERITGLDVKMFVHKYTNPISKLSDILTNTLANKTYEALAAPSTGNYFSEDGFALVPITETIDMEIKDNMMTIKDTPLAKGLPSFYLFYYFREEETITLRGKTLEGVVTIGKCDQPMNLIVASWDGSGKIENAADLIVSMDNDQPNFGADWTKLSLVPLGALFSGQQQYTTKAVIPNNARMCCVALACTMQETPLECNVIDLVINVYPEFNGAILKYVSPSEQSFTVRTSFGRYVQDNQGYGALRYTINQNESPCPIGMLLGTSQLPVTIDPTVNSVSGSSAKGGEGAFHFTQDVTQVTISTTVRVSPGESLPSGASQVDFIWYKVGVDGSYTPYPNGHFTLSVWKGSPPTTSSFMITGDFLSGDRLALKFKSQGADYAYMQATNAHVPMIENVISADILNIK